MVKVSSLDFFIYYSNKEGFIYSLLKLGVKLPLFFVFQPKLAVLNQLSLSFQSVFSFIESLAINYLVVSLVAGCFVYFSLLAGFQFTFFWFLKKLEPFLSFFKFLGEVSSAVFCYFLIDSLFLSSLFQFFKELQQQLNRGWSSILILPSLNKGSSRLNIDSFLDMVVSAAILRFEMKTVLYIFILSIWNIEMFSSKQCYLQYTSN